MTPQRQKLLDLAIKAFFSQLKDDKASLDASSVTRFNVFNTGKIVHRRFLEYAGFKSAVAWKDDEAILRNGCFYWSKDVPSEEEGLIYRLFLNLDYWTDAQVKAKESWVFLRLEAYKASADYVTFEPIDRLPVGILEGLQARLMLQSPCADWGALFPSLKYLMSIHSSSQDSYFLKNNPVGYYAAVVRTFVRDGYLSRASSLAHLVARPLLFDDDPEGRRAVMTCFTPSHLLDVAQILANLCNPVPLRAVLGAYLLIEWDALDENQGHLWRLIRSSSKIIQSPGLTYFARRISDSNCKQSLQDLLSFLIVTDHDHSDAFLDFLQAYCEECAQDLGLQMRNGRVQLERLDTRYDEFIALDVYVRCCLAQKKQDWKASAETLAQLQAMIEERSQEQNRRPSRIVPPLLWVYWKCLTYTQQKRLGILPKGALSWVRESYFYPVIKLPNDPCQSASLSTENNPLPKGQLFGRYPWRFQRFDFHERKEIELRVIRGSRDLKFARMAIYEKFKGKKEKRLLYDLPYLDPQAFPANVRATVWQVEFDDEQGVVAVCFTLDECHYLCAVSPTGLRECITPFRGIERSARVALLASIVNRYDEVQPKSFQPFEQEKMKGGYALIGTVLAIRQILNFNREPSYVLTLSIADEPLFGQLRTLPVVVPAALLEGVRLQIGESILALGRLYVDCDEPTDAEVARARMIDPTGREVPLNNFIATPHYYECVSVSNLKKFKLIELCKKRLEASYGIGRVKGYRPNCEFIQLAARRGDGGTDVYSVEIHHGHERVKRNPYTPKCVKVINMRIIEEGEWAQITYDGAPPAMWPGVDESKLQQQMNQNGKKNG